MRNDLRTLNTPRELGVSPIVYPGYPGAYGLRNEAHAVFGIVPRGYVVGRSCPDCIGYPCECGTAGSGC